MVCYEVSHAYCFSTRIRLISRHGMSGYRVASKVCGRIPHINNIVLVEKFTSTPGRNSGRLSWPLALCWTCAKYQFSGQYLTALCLDKVRT